MRIAFTFNLQTGEQVGRTEGDSPENVARITAALGKLGHLTEPIEVSEPVGRVIARLEQFAPDLVFNTAEGTAGRFREALYPALYEALGLPFTGSDAYVCTVTLDKWLTKKVLAGHGIPMPRAVRVTPSGEEGYARLQFPVIAKPNFEGSSLGITQESVCESERELEQRLPGLLASFPGGILVEEFIAGEDIVVPFLEAAPGSGVLAPYRYVIDPAVAADRRYGIYDFELKQFLSDAVQIEAPARVPAPLSRRITGMAETAFRVLGIRDLGRLDFRVSRNGEPFFIEANALPSLEPGAGIFDCAALAGIPSIEALLDTVITSAVRRYPARFATAATAGQRTPPC